MEILDDIPFELDPGDVFERLHLEARGQYADEVNALIAQARHCARPRAAYKTARVQERAADAVVIVEAPGDSNESVAQGCGSHRPSSLRRRGVSSSGSKPARARFVSRALRVNLDDVDTAFAYVVTCGRELDSMSIASSDVFGQFCHDVIKEMVLWVGIAHLYEHLQEAYGLSTLASMNPGSGEANVWPIEEQRGLFDFLGDVEEATGVALTSSCLMVPNKSVSGILFPSDSGFEGCHLCLQARCPDRRAPFDPHLWKEMFGEVPRGRR